MTLTENGLRAACGGRALDLLNMGVIGRGVARVPEPRRARRRALLARPRARRRLPRQRPAGPPPVRARPLARRAAAPPLVHLDVRQELPAGSGRIARGAAARARGGGPGRGAGVARRRAGGRHRGPRPRTIRRSSGRCSRTRPIRRCWLPISAASTGRRSRGTFSTAWQPCSRTSTRWPGPRRRRGAGWRWRSCRRCSRWTPRCGPTW